MALVLDSSEHVLNYGTMDVRPIAQTVRFSDLSRDSKKVAAAADRGPVMITRRDGEPLVLQRQSVYEQNRAGLALASQVIAAAVEEGSESFAERLGRFFPWMSFLPSDGRQQCASELAGVARACASVAVFEPLEVAVRAWQSTAEAYASGHGPDREYDWLDEPITVERP
jgi:PHD/YefM family antitoxin component YafN of YafNO toxin-antitoxin module